MFTHFAGMGYASGVGILTFSFALYTAKDSILSFRIISDKTAQTNTFKEQVYECSQFRPLTLWKHES